MRLPHRLWLDLETFNVVPLTHGLYKYAETAEVMIAAWAWDDDPVEVWDCTLPTLADWAARMQRLMDEADEVWAHNAMFDRTILRLQGVEVPIVKWRCTMAQANAHALPAGLEQLGDVMRIDTDKRKLKIGKELVMLFCKPRPKNQKIRRATRHTHPREWANFIKYGGVDVEAMRACHHKMPKWNYQGRELEIYHLDQRINDFGIPVDLDFCRAAIATAERVQKELATEARNIAAKPEGGAYITSTRQRDALLQHLSLEHGIDLPDLKGDTIQRRLDDPDLHWAVKALLNNRLESSRASTAKYKAIVRGASSDGRVRGTAQFDGASRTKRWAHRMMQPGNLKRTPKWLANRVQPVREAVADGVADLLYPSVMELLASAVPWAIAAKPGKKIVAPDLSNIEGRVLAWLAGEKWKLDAFRHYDEDTSDFTRDLYILGYAKSFRETVEDVVADYEAGGKKRQVGKVQELFLGYQGSVGAYVTGATTYGLDLEPFAKFWPTMPEWAREKAVKAYERAMQAGGHGDYGLTKETWCTLHCFVSMWRKANPMIVALWYDLERAIRKAIREPGVVIPVGKYLEVDRVKAWLRIRLPSGTYLTYPSPRVGDDEKISYMGRDQYSRRWKRIHSYGGKFAENVTQAVARDVLADGMLALDELAFDIFMHVHDEAASEVDESVDSQLLSDILATNPPWSADLPLSAKWYESPYYRKD